MLCELDEPVRNVCIGPAPAAEPARPDLDEMLGTLAHELRSPLAAIVSAVQLTAEDRGTDLLTRRTLASVERQSRQALRIIDNLFDACADARGKLFLFKEVVPLAEVVELAAETVTHSLAARRHRLTVSLPPEPVFLECDPARLVQVLTNLLTNAAKFTDSGGHIQLTARVDSGQVELRVTDNGRGIAAQLLPRVFERFWQGSGASTSGGLGLGLALVKSLVELHAGTIAVFSNGPGTGTEFTVRLPVGACG